MEEEHSFDYKKEIAEKVKLLGLKSKRFSYSEIGSKAKKEIERARLKHRTDIELDDWKKLKYYKNHWCQKILMNPPKGMQEIAYEEYDNLSIEEFREKYEKKNKPVIIKGCTLKWPAHHKWNFDNLYYRFKDSKVKVGEDDEGYKIKIKFKYFMDYLLYNKDDSPLYLFESSIENHKELRNLIAEYVVPKYFSEDFFELLGEDKRPPYRWFLVGPKRSGTSIHIDPLGTNAWNASLKGHKLWLLLPPDIPRHIAKGKEVMKKGDDDEAIMYMKEIFPKLKEKYSSYLNEMWFVQRPGELVFVPGGWWHVVVNLDDTIAVTQNYCDSVNFEKVWGHVRSERRKMAVKFLRKLKKFYPEFYEKAVQMNKKDGFLMYDELKRVYEEKKKSMTEEEKENYQARRGSSNSSSSSEPNSSTSSSSTYSSDSE